MTTERTARELLAHYGLSDGVIAGVLDLHAHQLAEQIRTDARARHDRDYSDNRIFRLTGAQSAADLIDPETPS